MLYNCIKNTNINNRGDNALTMSVKNEFVLCINKSKY